MVNDILGRELKAGQRVAYPVRKGSKMWLNTLRVTKVAPDKITGYRPDGRVVHVKSIANVVIADGA